MPRYQGKAPLTLARISDGTYKYVYRGDPVPADTQDLERLLKRGFVEEADDEASGVAHGAEQSANEADEKPETDEKPASELPAPKARR
jgi:hypothetical protein